MPIRRHVLSRYHEDVCHRKGLSVQDSGARACVSLSALHRLQQEPNLEQCNRKLQQENRLLIFRNLPGTGFALELAFQIPSLIWISLQHLNCQVPSWHCILLGIWIVGSVLRTVFFCCI